ncbi:C2 domain-containing protein [Chytridium lagenaria]|nr:C2 domain-containing protein [Chytridium lagenaria]
MDRATELTDAFVELRFSDYDPVRTQIARKTLNPVWNEDFRFEVSDDADLQNEPLEVKVMDYDQITYNDAIGTVFIDLNPLLSWESRSQMAGWFSNRIRGEMNVQVKLQFFGDSNRFSDSSAVVQFFSLPRPVPFHTAAVLGFVSAMDIMDDPEYNSRPCFNSAVDSVVNSGKKVLELNGNAVIGYRQFFDLRKRNKRTITARAIGTAIRILLPDSSETSGAMPRNFLLSNMGTPMDTGANSSPGGGMSPPVIATAAPRQNTVAVV